MPDPPPWRLLVVFSLIPASLPSLALFLSPTDVLDRSSLLQTFTNGLAARIPGITAHADATSIPQVARLVDSLTVAVVPLIAAAFLAYSTMNYRALLRRHLAFGPHPLRSYFLALLLGPLMLGAVAVAVMLPGDVSWARGATQDRTLFYAFVAFGLPWGAGFGLGGMPLMLRLFLDGFLFDRPVTIKLEP